MIYVDHEETRSIESIELDKVINYERLVFKWEQKLKEEATDN